MTGLSDYDRAVREVDSYLDERLRHQVLDETRNDDGGYLSPGLGFANPAFSTDGFLTHLGLAYLTPESTYFEDDEILERFRRAVAFQRRCQRDSGLIDLYVANFDSAPDTAFGVAEMAKVARMARNAEAAGAAEVESTLKPYLISAADGIAEGGFHTANHRWVMVDAMAQVHELYPDEKLLARIEEYLDETIDINDDGEYSERSHAIYTNVVNRHLIGTAQALDRPELLEPVRRALHTMVDLMDDDWTVLTDLSTRQDQGQRTVPIRGTADFYYVARYDDDDRLAAAARALLEEGGWERGNVAPDVLSHIDRHPEWRDGRLEAEPRSESFSRHMPDSGLWRVRDGKLSATVATGTPNVVSFSYGETKLVGLQVLSPYFGGEFEGEALAVDGDRATVSIGTSYWRPDLPGYWEPLGRPVQWQQMERDERDVVPQPDFDVDLVVERVPDGLDVTLSVAEGLPQVPFVLEAQFAPDGDLEFEDASVPAPTGEPIFHKSGRLVYRTDGDAISIEPGFCANRVSEPPGAGPSDGVVRVLLTDWSPVERTVSIRGVEWTGVADDPNAGPAAVSKED